MSIVPPLITAGGGLLESGVQMVSNNSSARKNYKYAERLAQNNYARQMDAWNKQNEYNLPVNVRERLRQGNLSVGLMYSDGNAAGYNAGGLSSVSSGQNGTHQPVRGEGYMANIINALALRKQDAEIRNIDADTENKQANTQYTSGARTENTVSQTELNHALGENTRAKTTGQELDNNLKEQTLPINVADAEVRYHQNKNLLMQYSYDLEKSHYESMFLSQTFDDRKAIIQTDLQNKLVGVALQGVQMKALEKGIQLTDTQIKQLKSLILIQSQELMQEEVNTKKAQATSGKVWIYGDKIASWLSTIVGGAGILIGRSIKGGKVNSSTNFTNPNNYNTHQMPGYMDSVF